MHRNLYRGLAVAAVSSLAITLAPTAQADSVDAQVGAGQVVLFSQFGASNAATAKADGTDSTIHLEAGAGSNISSVTFQYSINGGAYTDIATVSRNADGTFTQEWTPDGVIVGASNVTVRARATVGGGTVTSDATGLTIAAPGGSTESVNLADGGALGVFQQPYGVGNEAHLVVLSGTTSATSGSVELTRRDGTGAAAGASTSASVDVASGATTGTFRDTLDISGYQYDNSPTNPVNQVVLGAENGSDDTEAYTLYVQKITEVTAVAKDSRVVTGGTTDVTVTVADQNGNPIPGARVASGTTTLGYTDADGQLVTPQSAGTATYHADATAAAGFSAVDGDVKADAVTVTAYTPVATTLVGKSADGTAYDDDEFASGDLAIVINDQFGNPVVPGLGQAVRYYWTTTPFAGGADVRQPASGTATASGAGDTRTVTAPTTAGTSVLHAELTNTLGGTGGLAEAVVLTVKHGAATLAFDDASPQQVGAGTTADVTGSLELADGTALAGRNVDLAYTRATAGTGTETPTPKDATPDAGLVLANGSLGLTLTVKTGADGAFSASVKDPAETPQHIEIGGSLAASTAVTPQIGDADAAAGPQGIDFVKSVEAATVTVAAPTNLLGTATPGRPVKSSVTVKAADGMPLANKVVTLATDHGYFTTDAATAADLEPAAAPVDGAEAGAYKSLGDSVEVKTNSSGVATFTLAIDRDEDFDDDGAATATVTATVGAASGSRPVAWTSADPYNGGEVSLEVSPSSLQSIKPLPKAPITSRVYYDVTVTDQFGNPVVGESVDLADDTAKADLSVGSVTSDLTKEGDFYADADEATDQKITATWSGHTHTFSVTGTAPAQTVSITADSEDQIASDTVNWYVADLATATYGLAHSPSGKLPVGANVSVIYAAVDSNGQPVPNVWVQFFRTGAGAVNNGEPVAEGRTDARGMITYVFQGTKAGNATIAVIARDGGNTGPVIAAGQKFDTITFVNPRKAITASIRGKNVGKKGKDQITVSTNAKAAGAVVKLFKVVKGKRVKVKASHLNAKGRKVFKVADPRPGAKTTYLVVIKQTAKTLKAVSKTIKLK